MKINSAIILCAGLGKRLNPITLNTPKPLLKLNNITLLERCIDLLVKLKVEKIFLNTFHLSDQISDFIEEKKFTVNIKIIDDGKTILDTGGGILNMTNHSSCSDFFILNPDTVWREEYIDEINKMKNFYFSKNLDNTLLVTNKSLSFDKDLKGDFRLEDNILKKNKEKDSIYIGCQILNKKLFKDYKVHNFPISKIWNVLLKKNKLNGFESFNKFYHLTNLDIFKKLKDF